MIPPSRCRLLTHNFPCLYHTNSARLLWLELHERQKPLWSCAVIVPCKFSPPPHPRVRHDTKRTMAKGILFALEGSLCMPSISFLVNGSKPSVALHLIRRTFLHFFLLQVMNLQTLQLAVHCSGWSKSFLTFLISASAPLAFTFNTPFLQGSYLFLVPISP